MDELAIKNCLVLMVDDNPKNIQLLGSILSKEGYRIAIATSGHQALSIANKIIPDLILLDVMLPDIQGFDVCRQLRGTPETQDIPVLFLTAKTETEDKIKGFNVGGTDYLTKPYEAGEILARVRTQLTLRLAQKQLLAYNQQLEGLLKERTKDLIKSERQAAFSLLIKGIVHNLKNPLFTILGSFEMIQQMQEEFKQNPQYAQMDPCVTEVCARTYDMVRIGEASAKTLLDLIESLMAKSRSDKRESLEIVDINELIQQELKFMEADAQLAYKVKKEFTFYPQSLPVEVVPVEFVQVFQNLVRNALDAMRGRKDAVLRIETGLDNGAVFFLVSDNGPGIELETQSKIFDPFFTTKTKTNPDYEGPEGNGLGLYTCREMVSSYQGKIELTSEPGQGTHFRVSFPRWG